MAPQSHDWVYNLRKLSIKTTHVPQRLLQQHLQQPRYGSNLDVHGQMNG